ncbi:MULTISPECIES: hypothetical protein [unclassified Streptomyces]|uniref:hypothetical protein n=1 Tax=unclassified Streptomyces TaxID=2593676 RepID=UPI003D72BE0A
MAFLLALPALLGLVVIAVALVVKLASAALPGRRPDWAVDLLRWVAGLGVAAGVCLYLVGVGAVSLVDHESKSGADSSPSQECRDVPSETRKHLVGSRPSYLPLAFDCVLDDGSTYPSDGSYTWFNRLSAGCLVGGAASLVAGGFVTERRERRRARAAAEPTAEKHPSTG